MSENNAAEKGTCRAGASLGRDLHGKEKDCIGRSSGRLVPGEGGTGILSILSSPEDELRPFGPGFSKP